MPQNTPDDGQHTMDRLMEPRSLKFTRRNGPFDEEDGCAHHAARIAYAAGLSGIEPDEERTLPVLSALLNDPVGGGIERAADRRFHRSDIHRRGVTEEMLSTAVGKEDELAKLRRKPVAALWTILNRRGVLAIIWSPFGLIEAGQRVRDVDLDWRHDPRTSFIAAEGEEIDRIEGFEAVLDDRRDDEADAELRGLQLDALGAWQRRAEDEMRRRGLAVEWLQYAVRDGDGVGWRTIYDTHARQLRKATDPDDMHIRMRIGREGDVERLIEEGREELSRGTRDLLDRWKRHGRSRHAIVKAGHAIDAMIRADMVPQDLLDGLGIAREGARSKLASVLAMVEEYADMLPTRPGYIE